MATELKKKKNNRKQKSRKKTENIRNISEEIKKGSNSAKTHKIWINLPQFT